MGYQGSGGQPTTLTELLLGQETRYVTKRTARHELDAILSTGSDAQTLQLVPLYANIQSIDASLAYALPSPPPTLPDDSDYDFDFVNTLNIFGESKQVDIQSRFRRDADAFYVEAKRSIVSNTTQVPTWMYGLLALLGWNEAMLVLFNPFYLVLSLIALVVGYVLVGFLLVF